MQILGVGTCSPDHDALQVEAAELHALLSVFGPERARTLRALYRRSGVRRRGSVLLERGDGPLVERQRFYHPARTEEDRGPTTAQRMSAYEAHAPRMATEAAGRALTDARLDPSAISHLVTVTCTGFMSPGIDARLVHALGLPAEVTRTQVGFMGCHGALNGLRVAQGYAGADPRSVTLVCAVELCSLHLAYGWDPEAMVANALFADGAAAVVCGGDEVRNGSGAPAGDEPAPWRIAASGTLLLSGSSGDMTWTIGDHGFRMTLSPRVPEIIGRELAGFLDGWLGRHGVRTEDVATWAVHPGGPRILDAVEGALGLDREATAVSRAVLADHGNMSSATVLFIVERLRSRGAPLPCVALAFGPGLVAEVVLVT